MLILLSFRELKSASIMSTVRVAAHIAFDEGKRFRENEEVMQILYTKKIRRKGRKPLSCENDDRVFLLQKQKGCVENVSNKYV